MDKESLFSIGNAKPTVRLARIPPPPPTKPADDHADATVRGTSAADGSGSERQIEKALLQLTAHVQNLQRRLEFSVDEESGETIVRVVDRETKEVIRQIPSAELLAIEERLRSAAGVLVAERI